MNPQKPPKSGRNLVIVAALAGAALIGLSTVLIPRFIAPATTSINAYNTDAFRPMPGPIPVPSASLTDMNGKPFTAANFKGKWTFLYFGYTLCPDVCPVELTALANVAKDLRAHPPTKPVDWQMVFISVDPDRDTLEKIKQFVTYYDPAIIGATGTEPMLRDIATPLGAGWEKTGLEMDNGKMAGGTYFINHTTTIFLVNPAGQMVAVFPTPHNPDLMATAFKQWVSNHPQ